MKTFEDQVFPFVSLSLLSFKKKKKFLGLSSYLGNTLKLITKRISLRENQYICCQYLHLSIKNVF